MSGRRALHRVEPTAWGGTTAAWWPVVLCLALLGCGPAELEPPSLDDVRVQFAADGHFDEQSLASLRRFHALLPRDQAGADLLKTALIERQDWNSLVALLAEPTGGVESPEQRLERSILLASVLLRAQRLPEAAEVVARQRERSPEHLRLIWLQAYTAFHRGQLDQAATLFDQHLDALAQAGLAEALLLSGTLALQRAEPERARGALERFVAAQPEHAAGHNALGRALAMLGDEGGAQQHLERARALHAGSSRAESAQALLSAQASALNAAFARADYAQAERLLEAMLPTADPRLQAELYRMAARVQQAQGHAEQADEALRLAAQLELAPR